MSGRVRSRACVRTDRFRRDAVNARTPLSRVDADLGQAPGTSCHVDGWRVDGIFKTSERVVVMYWCDLVYARDVVTCINLIVNYVVQDPKDVPKFNMSVQPFDAVLMLALESARCVAMRAVEPASSSVGASGVYALCVHESTGVRTLHAVLTAAAATSGDEPRARLVWHALMHTLAACGVLDASAVKTAALSERVRDEIFVAQLQTRTLAQRNAPVQRPGGTPELFRFTALAPDAVRAVSLIGARIRGWRATLAATRATTRLVAHCVVAVFDGALGEWRGPLELLIMSDCIVWTAPFVVACGTVTHELVGFCSLANATLFGSVGVGVLDDVARSLLSKIGVSTGTKRALLVVPSPPRRVDAPSTSSSSSSTTAASARSRGSSTGQRVLLRTSDAAYKKLTRAIAECIDASSDDNAAIGAARSLLVDDGVNRNRAATGSGGAGGSPNTRRSKRHPHALAASSSASAVSMLISSTGSGGGSSSSPRRREASAFARTAPDSPGSTSSASRRARTSLDRGSRGPLRSSVSSSSSSGLSPRLVRV
jgi:hypothetical protein